MQIEFIVCPERIEEKLESVFFIYKPATKTAIIISARDMSDKERRTYGRK